MHIDFGFILSISPGNMNFENALFKMTKDYLELMNGKSSSLFNYFYELMVEGFILIKNNCESIFQLIEIMMEGSNFPCFRFFDMNVFKERFKRDYNEE